jgi:hypothetical protein
VFEKRVLRRIFGPKREEVAGGNQFKENEVSRAYSSTHRRDEKYIQILNQII